MKKLFIFSLLFLFLIASVSAWSYDSSYSSGCADAYAEVIGQYPQCDGNSYGEYCAGDGWFVNVNYVGDKFYLGENVNSWNQISCNSNGCTGIPQTTPGKKYLDINGEFPHYILYAWDYDTCDWAWAWSAKGGGYIGSGVMGRNVECYENQDCNSNAYCDKTGDFTEWSCKLKECNQGETKCTGTNFYTCSESYKWENQGSVLGNCGVECFSDGDCLEDGFYGGKFCSGNDVLQVYKDYSCINNLCSNVASNQIVEECTDTCAGGVCENRTLLEKIKNPLIIFLILGFITFVIYGISRKKRRRGKKR